MTIALENMHIDDHEIQLLMEGFPSIAILMRANKELLEERSPVDISTIVKVSSFYNVLDNLNS